VKEKSKNLKASQVIIGISAKKGLLLNKNSRICGYGVCGDCSKGRVNSNRTCDVCFRKVEIEPHEKRREDIVKSKAERVVKANDILKKRGTDADQCLKRINTVMEEVDINL